MKVRSNHRWLAVLAFAAGLVLIGMTSEAQAAKVTGPTSVTPGKKVVFKVSGLKPNLAFWVRLDAGGAVKELTTGVNGGYIFTGPRRRRVVRTFHADASGNATVRFRWLKRRTTCGASCADETVPWKKGSRAWVGFIRLRDEFVDYKVVAHKFVRIGKKRKPPTSRLPIRVTASRAIFRVDCPYSHPCKNHVTISKGKEILAVGVYSVKRHARDERVSINLTPAGKAAVARHKRIAVTLNLTVFSSGKKKSVPAILKRK